MSEYQEPLSTSRNWHNSLKILLLIFAFLAVGGGAVGYQMTKMGRTAGQLSMTGPTPTPTQSPYKAAALVPSESTATLIYGVWEGGNSVVKAINADGSNHVTIARLPSNIKDVNVISDHEILFIAETDNQDHGKKINLYDFQTGQTKTLFETWPGFGIDDVVISPDKKWLATWEVKFASGAKILSGGDSRVYIAPLATPQNKIFIVDEYNVSSTNFLRYPLFFDSSNRLFLDTFGPNGGGWNLGLWVVNADGSNLTPIPGMADGEFSIDPILSPDGTKIVFAGYDPSAFPQLKAASTSGVLRPAIANPNLLQMMDLSTLQKTTLLGSADGIQYANPVWSEDKNEVFFEQFRVKSETDSDYEGVFIYNLSSGQLASVSSLIQATPLLLNYSANDLFWGIPSQDTGNLGKNYESTFSSFSLTNLLSLQTTTLVSGLNLQFIEVLKKAPGISLALNVSSQALETTPVFSLKLKSFEIKPVAQVRIPQQNDQGGLPRCRDLLGKENKKDWAAAKRAGKCSDSPLYLYPEKETLVTIKVKLPVQILYSEPSYKDGWQVLAKPNGQLVAPDGKSFNKISYNYLTSFVNPPKTGLVVKKEELRNTLEIYASNIGLKSQEVADFISFWAENLPDSPYYLISHFHQEESAALLPLEIDPKPDTLIQVVMYFKPLEKSITAPSPYFEPVPKREGFVAIDWSGVVDRAESNALSTPSVD